MTFQSFSDFARDCFGPNWVIVKARRGVRFCHRGFEQRQILQREYDQAKRDYADRYGFGPDSEEYVVALRRDARQIKFAIV